MIPILYEANETNFTSNGIGRLRDAIKCEITEERNGVYELDLDYPIDGAHFDDIIPGRIICATHEESVDVQPFDIVSYTKPINGVVSFHAVHISYRQSFLTVSGTNINSLADALTMLENTTPSPNVFNYSADFSKNGYMVEADGLPHTVRQMLGGAEGSILDAYGGEYEFDRFRVILHQNRGQMRDFSIRYGVNMLDYNEDADFFGAFNSCVPYWTGENGPVIGNKVDSGLTLYNGADYCVPLDLTEKFETAPTTAQLEAEALTYMTGRQTNLPQRNIKVDFVRLQDFVGYEDFANLLECKLCDTIGVTFPRYGTSGTFKIVRTVWDALEGRYLEMELGALSTSLSEALGITPGGEGNASVIGGGDTIKFGVCSTAANTAAKTVTVAPALESLDTGALVFVKFSNSNTVANPTLNVNGLGAKGIRRYGTTTPSTSAASSWNAGSVVALVYDGSYWQMVGWLNTTYSSMTEAEYKAGTSTTARLITPARLKDAIQYWMAKPTVTTFAPDTGSTATGQECYYAKAGAVVSINIAVQGLTANSTATITTLPSGYRPRSKVTAAMQAGARSEFCSAEIDTDGVVKISTHASRTYAFGVITFVVE